jgi:hypothetical protein
VFAVSLWLVRSQATVTDVSADISNCGDGPPSFTGCGGVKGFGQLA